MANRDELRDWFCREVLPLEPALVRFLRRNWRDPNEIGDFRQDVFARMFDAARTGRPPNVRAFMFTVARNLLINHARRAKIVSFELVAEIEDSAAGPDEITPERIAAARDELRRVRAAIGQLPPRCQEIVLLRKVEGLSHREIAEHTGLSRRTVEAHLTRGMRGLADCLGGTGIGTSEEPPVRLANGGAA